MAVKVNGNNVILYKVDTSTFPATEVPFACSTNCSFSSDTELIEISSSTNAWFKESRANLSKWTMSCDGIITLDNFSYDEMLQYQRDRLYLLVRFEIDNGVDGKRYISGYCFIGNISISGNYKEIGTYNVNLIGTGQYYTEKTPTTTTSTTSTTTTTTSTTSTSTTTTTTSTTTTTTTTTTRAPVWYYLYNCSSGATETSQQYPYGTFAVDDRVVFGTSLYFTISSETTTDPSGTQYNVTATGLTGCPTTTTTSTTTTIPPPSVTATAGCVGLAGTGKVTADTFAGGTPPYMYLGFGTSEANAFLDLHNPATRTVLGGATSHVFGGSLANGDYWVTIQDSVGAEALSNKATVVCNATTTTTTTTHAPVWYNLLNCASGLAATSQQYAYGTFAVNERVVFGTSLYFTIVSDTTTDPGGVQYNVSTTGLTGCPATTTTAAPTTTIPPVSFNISYTCSSTTSAIVTIDTFAGGSGTGYSYGNTLFNYETDAYANTNWTAGTSKTYATSAYSTSGDLWAIVKDSVGAKLAKKVTPNCTGFTTTTTTTTTPPQWYLLYNCNTGTTYTSQQYLKGDFALNDRVTSTGQTYRIDLLYDSDPAGAHLAIASTGLTGCPATTTTSTTTTIIPITYNMSYTCSGTDAVVTIDTFAGGSGTGYSYGNTLFNYSSDAFANTNFTSGTSKVYAAQSFAVSGSLFAVVKDSVGQKVVKSVTPTCTTTTTTTSTTTTHAPYIVSLQVRGSTGSPTSAYSTYYKIDSGSWTLKLTTTLGTSYTSEGSITVPAGSTLYLAARRASPPTDATFGVGNGGSFTGYVGEASPYSFTPTIDTTVYLNVTTF
jgi:hypothetical protein